MKTKMYSLTTLCLFFIIQINAQIFNSSLSINQIDLTLSVKDDDSGQVFNLLAEDNHEVYHEYDFIKYNISLVNESQEEQPSYFWLRCQFKYSGYPNQTIPNDYPRFTATSPVIIPPVKKKNTNLYVSKKDYPYLAHIEYNLIPANYEVTIELLKYDNYDDYLEGNENFTVNTTKAICVNATKLKPNSRIASVTAFPNPITNYLIIEQPNNVVDNTPLKVTIFNNKGVKVSTHTLTNISTNTAKVLYNLDTSQLPKGTYYCQLSQGTKTQVKTIIKE